MHLETTDRLRDRSVEDWSGWCVSFWMFDFCHMQMLLSSAYLWETDAWPVSLCWGNFQQFPVKPMESVAACNMCAVREVHMLFYHADQTDVMTPLQSPPLLSFCKPRTVLTRCKSLIVADCGGRAVQGHQCTPAGGCRFWECARHACTFPPNTTGPSHVSTSPWPARIDDTTSKWAYLQRNAYMKSAM